MQQHFDNSPRPEFVSGFLLDIFHRTRDGKTVVFVVGKLETGETFAIADDRLHPVFYIRTTDEDVVRQALVDRTIAIATVGLTCMDGSPVLAVSCKNALNLRKFHESLHDRQIRTYEGDLTHHRRYMMAHDIRGSLAIAGTWKRGDRVDRVYVRPRIEAVQYTPSLSILSMDIETDMDGERVKTVTAVSLICQGPLPEQCVEEIHVVGAPQEGDPNMIIVHRTEIDLLRMVVMRIQAIDADVITGWNVVDFDLKTLQERCQIGKIPFVIGRSKDDSWYRQGKGWGQSRVNVAGRAVIDAMHLIRSTGKKFDDYSLETVSQTILGRGKTMHFDGDLCKIDAITQAYETDRQGFCEYCLEDARLVLDLLKNEQLIELAIRRSQLTGMPMGQMGSIAPFEFLYIHELHRRGLVAPTVGVDRNGSGGAPGGLVMSPAPGLYRNVFVFDFKSLYPSIIRTFNIDPLSHEQAWGDEKQSVITAPNDATFSREPGILPQLLDAFFIQRQKAKDEGNDVASYTYKIIMNSFYGVLGTSSCRFADGQLAGAITSFGHYVLRWSRKLLEENQCKVLYGDTDSLFVDADLPDDGDVEDAFTRARELCKLVNETLATHVRERYQVESKLELEFETLYGRLLLPHARGRSDVGRAKGYAGLVVTPESERLEIKGLEAVRRDWTDMAHHLQEELFHMIFRDAPANDVEAFVTRWVNDLRAGKMDDDLICRRSLRKGVEHYTKTTPPHVKAAMLLDNPKGVIRYLITTDGPQPLGKVSAPIDYRYYVEKQIEPIVWTIAQVYPINLNSALTGEQDLFFL